MEPVDPLLAEVTRIKASLEGTIRRLGVPPPPTWAHVAAAVGSVFGLPATGLAFTYIDDEGDAVTLSTDADLTEALRLKGAGGVLRLVLYRVEGRGEGSPGDGRTPMAPPLSPSSVAPATTFVGAAAATKPRAVVAAEELPAAVATEESPAVAAVEEPPTAVDVIEPATALAGERVAGDVAEAECAAQPAVAPDPVAVLAAELVAEQEMTHGARMTAERAAVTAASRAPATVAASATPTTADGGGCAADGAALHGDQVLPLPGASVDVGAVPALAGTTCAAVPPPLPSSAGVRERPPAVSGRHSGRHLPPPTDPTSVVAGLVVAVIVTVAAALQSVVGGISAAVSVLRTGVPDADASAMDGHPPRAPHGASDGSGGGPGVAGDGLSATDIATTAAAFFSAVAAAARACAAAAAPVLAEWVGVVVATITAMATWVAAVVAAAADGWAAAAAGRQPAALADAAVPGGDDPNGLPAAVATAAAVGARAHTLWSALLTGGRDSDSGGGGNEGGGGGSSRGGPAVGQQSPMLATLAAAARTARTVGVGPLAAAARRAMSGDLGGDGSGSGGDGGARVGRARVGSDGDVDDGITAGGASRPASGGLPRTSISAAATRVAAALAAEGVSPRDVSALVAGVTALLSLPLLGILARAVAARCDRRRRRGFGRRLPAAWCGPHADGWASPPGGWGGGGGRRRGRRH